MKYKFLILSSGNISHYQRLLQFRIFISSISVFEVINLSQMNANTNKIIKGKFVFSGFQRIKHILSKITDTKKI